MNLNYELELYDMNYIYACSILFSINKLLYNWKVFISLYPLNSIVFHIIDSSSKQLYLRVGCKPALDNNHLLIWGDERRYDRDREGHRYVFWYGYLVRGNRKRLQVEIRDKMYLCCRLIVNLLSMYPKNHIYTKTRPKVIIGPLD